MGDTDIITGTDDPTLKRAQEFYNRVKDCKFEKTWREDCITDLKYFTGEDQGWDEDGSRAKLEEEKRPAMTLNREAPIVRLICGARPPTDAKYSAVEEGDVETAQIFNECKGHVDRINKWDFLAHDWFRNMVVLKRSIVELRPDYSRDPRGEIDLVLRDGWEFYLDPDSKKKDRSDMQQMIEELTVSPEEAKRAFPKFKNRIDEFVGYAGDGSGAGTSRDSGNADEYTDSRSNYYDPASNKLKIVRYWYKDYETRTKIVDTMSDAVFDSPKSPEAVKKELDKSMAPERFALIGKEFVRVKYLTFVYDLVLEDDVTPWEREDGQPTDLSENFPFIIAEPDRMFVGTRHELMSIMNPLHDPQKFHNKLASAVIEIIGTTVKSGLDYEDGALSTEMEEKVKREGTKAGATIKWNAGALTGGKMKYRTSSANPQAEIMQAREMAESLLNISGVESLVSTESLGKGASGFAIDLKQRQGANVISWIYTSFRFFQDQLACFERDAIQTLYNYEKVIRIRGQRPKYVRINEQIYDQAGSVVQVLNDVTTGTYDVAVTDKELMPTMRLERFRYFTELVKSGSLPLPPEVMVTVVLHLLDDPELKDLVEEEMGQFMNAMQPQLPPGAPGTENQPPMLPQGAVQGA